MHLKVCPNPQCGKVSDVSATVCDSCGTAFPKIALAPIGVETPASSAQPDTVPSAAAASKYRLPAWPLVMVAVVAGGLPLLWANRAKLPTPKTWQVGADAPPIPAPLPSPIPAQKPPPTSAPPAEPPKAPAPAPAAVAPAVPASPVPAVAPASIDAGRTPTADAAEEAKKPAPRASGKSAKRNKKKSHKKTEPPPPCTEAVAALGLCDPNQAGK